MDKSVTDIREMRKLIREMIHTGRCLADPGQKISTASILARTCLDHAACAGLSGEDAMTLLAYHALLRLDEVYSRLLDYASMTPVSQFVPQTAATPTKGGQAE